MAERKPYMPSPDQYLNSLGGKQPSRRPVKQPRNWRRALKWLVAALLLALGALLIFIGVNLTRLSINPLDFGPLAGSESGRVNILVLGVGDPGHAGEKLSDTNMVISLNTQTKQVAMISLPRDLQVYIPGYGYHKINEANSLGGPEFAQQVVSDTLDIPMSYYILTDFTGLRELVNGVGGIDVNVKEELRDTEYPCEANGGIACGIDIRPGLQHMDGTTALQYVRCRKGTCGNDFGRAQRQQEVIKLVQAKVFSNETYYNPARWTVLSAVVGNNVKSNLSLTGLLRVGWHIHKAPTPINFVLSTAPGGLLVSGFGSNLVPADGDFTEIQRTVENIFTEPPQPD